jgi:alpha-tubulin suppressor-like RCC1 family protein
VIFPAAHRIVGRVLAKLIVSSTLLVACGASSGADARAGDIAASASASTSTPVASDPDADPPPTAVVPPARKAVSDRAAQLSLGPAWRCSLLAGGRVACWGDGNEERASRMPRELPGVSDWVALSVNWRGVCGITSTAVVECVASHDHERSPLHGLPDVVEIERECARTKKGEIVCVEDDKRLTFRGLAGATKLSKLEEGACVLTKKDAICQSATNANSSARPGEDDSTHVLADADEIASDETSDRMCARGRDGSVRCWSVSGQSGPYEIDSMRGVRMLTLGTSFLCGIGKSGSMRCARVGYRADEDDSLEERGSAFEVAGTKGVKSIAVGAYSAAALLDGGRIVTFSLRKLSAGRHPDGGRCVSDGLSVTCHAPGHARALRPDAERRATPVAGLDDAVELVADESERGGGFCGRRRDGHVVCFAGPSRDESSEMLSDRGLQRWDGTKSMSEPTVIQGLRATLIAAGSEHACALGTDARVRCWGDGRLGQLGDGYLQPRSRPGVVPGLGKVTSIAAGRYASYAVSGGSISCFGRCDGDWTTRTATPLAYRDAANQPVHRIEARDASLCWWHPDGKARCVVGDRPNRRAIDLGIVDDVSFGFDSLLARAIDGRLLVLQPNAPRVEATGYVEKLFDADLGQVGSKTVRVRVEGAPPRAHFDSLGIRGRLKGAAAGCLLHENGTVTCNAPVALPAKATQLAGGAAFACALLEDQTVACWGDTSFGKLGNGVASTSVEPSFVLLP